MTHHFKVKRKGIEQDVIIDSRFKKEVEKYNWFINADGYVWANIRNLLNQRKQLFLHHLILPRKVGLETDHINRNKLDNKLQNLRYANRRENVTNTNVRKDSKIGLQGVQWFSSPKKYGARIQINGRRIYLGLSDTKEEAHQNYLKVKQELSK